MLHALHLNNLRTIGDYGWSVSDANDGLSFTAIAEVLQQLLFGVHIQCAGGFVQQQYGTFAQQGTGDGDALSLTFTESRTKFSANCVQPIRTLRHKAGTSRFQCFVHFFFRCLRVTQQEVVADSSAEEGVALRYIYKIITCAWGDSHSLCLIVHLHLTFRRFEQGKDEAYEGGLPGTCLAKDCRGGAFGEVA